MRSPGSSVEKVHQSLLDPLHSVTAGPRVIQVYTHGGLRGLRVV